MHLTCTNINEELVKNALDGYSFKKNNIRNILNTLRGDPEKVLNGRHLMKNLDML